MSDLAAAAAALGGAFAVAKPVAETASRLAENLLGEPFKVAGGMLGDKVYEWQTCNRINALKRVNDRLESEGVSPKVIPSGFLLDALDAVGNVESEDLQDLWAALITSSVLDEKHSHPAFISVLSRMSVSDADLLCRIIEPLPDPNVDRPYDFVLTTSESGDSGDSGLHPVIRVSKRGDLSVINLHILGLFVWQVRSINVGGGLYASVDEALAHCRLSPFGGHFSRAIGLLRDGK